MSGCSSCRGIQGGAVSDPGLQRGRICGQRRVEFPFEVDAGAPRTVIGLADLLREADVEFERNRRTPFVRRRGEKTPGQAGWADRGDKTVCIGRNQT